MVINTATPHGLTTGDTVEISGHQINLAANGQQTVTVTSGSQFNIPGTGTAPGGATGTVRPLTFGSSFSIPSTGDLISAANNNIAPESLADRTSLLLLSTGNPKLAQLFFQPQTDANIITAFPLLNFWTVTIGGIGWTNASSSLSTVQNVQRTDLLEIRFNGYVTSAGFASGSQFLSLAYSSYAPGVAPPSPTRIGGSGFSMGQLTSSSSIDVTLSGIIPYFTLTTGSVDIWLQGASTGGNGTIDIAKESTLTVKVWRPVFPNQ
jgi:hypothetical protein